MATGFPKIRWSQTEQATATKVVNQVILKPNLKSDIVISAVFYSWTSSSGDLIGAKSEVPQHTAIYDTWVKYGYVSSILLFVYSINIYKYVVSCF